MSTRIDIGSRVESTRIAGAFGTVVARQGDKWVVRWEFGYFTNEYARDLNHIW